MNTLTTTSNSPDQQEKIKNLIAALQLLKPKKISRRAEEFAQIFETIFPLLKKDVSQKGILETLSANGLDMSSATFRKLLKAECDARNIKIDTTKKGTARYRA